MLDRRALSSVSSEVMAHLVTAYPPVVMSILLTGAARIICSL